jgi:polysaccharide biosynthesis protein PslG
VKYALGVRQSKISKYCLRGRLWLHAWRQRPLVAVAGALVLLAVAGGAYIWLTTPSPAASPTRLDTKTAANSPKPPTPVTVQSNGRNYGLALGDTLPFLTPEQLNSELDNIARLGVNWIRIDMAWPDIQPQSSSQYDWGPMDRVVAAASARHIHILGILDYSPVWARVAGCTSTQKCAPANDAQYATFAAAVVKRYTPHNVHSWEIWNEPNMEGSWQPAPDPAAYTRLLQAAYPAIKHADPEATVVTGGLGPLDNSKLSIPQLTFLQAIYADGAKPYFDAVGYHPYSYPALPSYTISWNSWSTLAALPTSVRSIMATYNDSTKPVWITEYGAPTNGPGNLATLQNPNLNNSPDRVDEALQAQMLTEAVGQYKATDWLGNFFWYSYRDLGTATDTSENFYGLLRYDGSHKPAYDAYRVAITKP